MMLRRLAINLYFLEQPPPNPVAAERLGEFFNAAAALGPHHLRLLPSR